MVTLKERWEEKLTISDRHFTEKKITRLAIAIVPHVRVEQRIGSIDIGRWRTKISSDFDAIFLAEAIVVWLAIVVVVLGPSGEPI